ncbi:hypothetical protein QWY86_09410 [Pedobacter aquatilis]|uniref:AbiU2 domain-containing protein n=1 Tax=Pedobacter aquatilis TaxID=351343 RepID=UPI0025B46DF2|nr:hypothetical protein [Pedobacter aquatilis]MDN3586884.1 hypothetical protein [Pedobacter aquatilis]
MKNLKAELGVKLEKILHVYIFAQEAYLYTEYFHNPDTIEELDLLTKSPHTSNLSTIMHLMFRTVIVEVSKLYSRSDNDKFQLENFINSLSSSGHFKKLKISAEHVGKWKNLLSDNKHIIDNILTLRSKLYAHTDNPMISYNNEIDISFKEIKILLDICSEILKNIYHDVFNTHLLTDSPTFDRERFLILKSLARGEKDRQEEIVNKYKVWR